MSHAFPLHGQSFIASRPVPGDGAPFQCHHAATAEPLAPPFREASPAQAHAALEAAEAAFDAFRATAPAHRARFLDTLAAKIEALGGSLIERAQSETALPTSRLLAERDRVTTQARLFASLIRDNSWLNARIDRAIPERSPLPKPDIRQMLLPLGPVVVFGASNFPLAISVAGTDTVSALAAGCPVVTKAHPAHAGTCEMIAGALTEALREHQLPEGVFSMLHGKGETVGMAMVQHPLTRAVAFTGSLRGGRALFNAAVTRPDPIPFYGELGSLNPVFLLPGALRQRAALIADAFVNSLTMGVGQYCTNPGLVFGLKSPELSLWQQEAASRIEAWQPAAMLHSGISQGFHEGLKRLGEHPQLHLTASSPSAPPCASAVLFTTELRHFEEDPTLREEIFGPVSLLSQAASMEDLERVATSFDGQLTASIHGTEEDLREHHRLVRILERKAGRLIFNGFGTGIEVCPAMHHGGPYPATTHPYFTSIGTAAIYRFVRPVCYQNFPDGCLPAPLQNANPSQSWRLIDGRFTTLSA